MLFSLSDIQIKLEQKNWRGQINFYPSGQSFTLEVMSEHQNYLRQNLQFAFGDKIIVVTTPTPETVATLLWLWHQGAVVVPVKHDMEADAIQRIADDCHAHAMIKDQTITELEPSPQPQLLFRENSSRQVCGTDLALLIYTSGSTGKPKGIMLSHSNVITAMNSIATYLKIDSEEHILGLSPLSFDYGLYQLLFSLAFDCGFTLFEENFHPIKVIKALDEQQITLLPVVPAMAISLAKILRALKRQLPHLRKLTNTGGHLGETVIDDLISLVPQLNVYAMYGLTECKRALYLPPDKTQQKRGSVGIAIPGLEAKLFNKVQSESGPHYQEVATGDVGELFVRGATVMQGYYGQANAGANLIPGNYRDDNWLATGDLFSQDEDGYFYFKGRTKELIKQAGFCIYPTESEALIEKCPLVHLAAIIQSEDKFGDEIACLCLQLHDNSKENQDAFKNWLKANTDPDYRPREVRFIEQMQLTANSKVDKQSLVAKLEPEK
ncbi:AMP-binding protein [Thalassomonas viridans]|uniref:AMP-binding protein n=1 Tax=Thalassomonas viridans TaxID=137584 RepID=A0AAE9ZFN9_9GAMM|nr:AMP-binding protein [Thalassomonas viridans]WDE09092.1 AMP-binding protein [Thalassomonas viridans]